MQLQGPFYKREAGECVPERLEDVMLLALKVEEDQESRMHTDSGS